MFQDVNAIYMYDELHSIDEDRFNVIGMIDSIDHEITVCHCYRDDNDEVIRLISARKATKEEIKLYKGGFIT